jgi:hypothetical protein
VKGRQCDDQDQPGGGSGFWLQAQTDVLPTDKVCLKDEPLVRQ